MTSAKRQKVITIETHQQTLIRLNGKTFVAWCEACGTEALMIKPEQAAVIYNTTMRDMFRQIENGELHFIETTKGELFVCSSSLQQQKF